MCTGPASAPAGLLAELPAGDPDLPGDPEPLTGRCSAQSHLHSRTTSASGAGACLRVLRFNRQSYTDSEHRGPRQDPMHLARLLHPQAMAGNISSFSGPSCFSGVMAHMHCRAVSGRPEGGPDLYSQPALFTVDTPPALKGPGLRKDRERPLAHEAIRARVFLVGDF